MKTYIIGGKEYKYICNVHNELLEIFHRLESVDMDDLYSRMYHDIVFNDKGIKPKDTMFLNWIMERAGWLFGHGYDMLGKKVEFKPNDLVDLVK